MNALLAVRAAESASSHGRTHEVTHVRTFARIRLEVEGPFERGQFRRAGDQPIQTRRRSARIQQPPMPPRPRNERTCARMQTCARVYVRTASHLAQVGGQFPLPSAWRSANSSIQDQCQRRTASTTRATVYRTCGYHLSPCSQTHIVHIVTVIPLLARCLPARRSFPTRRSWRRRRRA